MGLRSKTPNKNPVPAAAENFKKSLRVTAISPSFVLTLEISHHNPSGWMESMMRPFPEGAQDWAQAVHAGL